MVYPESSPCPCHSGHSYGSCCQPFHQGAKPPTAVALMRSRYCAYALSLVQYIVDTTHPNSPSRHEDLDEWREQVRAFSAKMTFDSLAILASEETAKEAFVTFRAGLSELGRDAGFTEKSRFRKRKGYWLYLDGVVSRSPS